MLVFVDDILIYTAKHLRMVLDTLIIEKLHGKLSIYKFWLESISFLGHIISRNRISIDPKNVAAVGDWPNPKSMTKVRDFLELVRYYQRFIMTSPRLQELWPDWWWNEKNMNRQDIVAQFLKSWSKDLHQHKFWLYQIDLLRWFCIVIHLVEDRLVFWCCMVG